MRKIIDKNSEISGLLLWLSAAFPLLFRSSVSSEVHIPDAASHPRVHFCGQSLEQLDPHSPVLHVLHSPPCMPQFAQFAWLQVRLQKSPQNIRIFAFITMSICYITVICTSLRTIVLTQIAPFLFYTCKTY